MCYMAKYLCARVCVSVFVQREEIVKEEKKHGIRFGQKKAVRQQHQQKEEERKIIVGEQPNSNGIFQNEIKKKENRTHTRTHASTKNANEILFLRVMILIHHLFSASERK